MRIFPAVILAATLAWGAAAAQQPGSSGGIGSGQGPPSGTVKEQPPRAVCDPSFGGKYSGLLRQLAIPEDSRQYGACHDYGRWAGGSYKGHTNLPPNAFWTYSAPNWYIWARRGGAAQRASCPDPTFGGKYAEELRRLEVPADLARYGACNDYGPWAGTSYAGHTDLPNGYWVYSYPHWIIYAKRGAGPSQ
jgi:hypothetical protein